jgi:hypothetical protein
MENDVFRTPELGPSRSLISTTFLAGGRWSLTTTMSYALSPIRGGLETGIPSSAIKAPAANQAPATPNRRP